MHALLTTITPQASTNKSTHPPGEVEEDMHGQAAGVIKRPGVVQQPGKVYLGQNGHVIDDSRRHARQPVPQLVRVVHSVQPRLSRVQLQPVRVAL